MYVAGFWYGRGLSKGRAHAQKRERECEAQGSKKHKMSVWYKFLLGACVHFFAKIIQCRLQCIFGIAFGRKLLFGGGFYCGGSGGCRSVGFHTALFDNDFCNGVFAEELIDFTEQLSCIGLDQSSGRAFGFDQEGLAGFSAANGHRSGESRPFFTDNLGPMILQSIFAGAEFFGERAQDSIGGHGGAWGMAILGFAPIVLQIGQNIALGNAFPISL